jgi:hypothetical protein
MIIEEIKEEISKAQSTIKSLGLSVVDNVHLLCYALEQTKNLDGCFIECGVYKGSTLFTSHEFSKLRGIDKKFVGIDTFGGFPVEQTQNANDSPDAFKVLYEQGRISEQHYQRSLERLSSLKNDSHLNSEYFAISQGDVFEEAKKRSITLIRGKFSDVLPSFHKPISVLHIDCDLYEPYLECLNLLYDKIVSGGIIVFDEYYSLKYPGARIAVDEFLSKLDKNKFEFKKHVTSNFERWYLLKK